MHQWDTAQLGVVERALDMYATTVTKLDGLMIDATEQHDIAAQLREHVKGVRTASMVMSKPAFLTFLPE